MSTRFTQRIYVGPQIPTVVSYSTIFRTAETPKNILAAIKECPSIGELIIPITEFSHARKELNFDIGRNMRGTEGKLVTFYHEVENWLRAKSKKQPSTGVKLQHA